MLPPALGGLRSRVPPVPGRHAPGSMEKIKLSRGQGMHPSRKTLKLYYFWVEVVKSRDSSKISSTKYSSLMQCMLETPSRISS